MILIPVKIPNFTKKPPIGVVTSSAPFPVVLGATIISGNRPAPWKIFIHVVFAMFHYTNARTNPNRKLYPRCDDPGPGSATLIGENLGKGVRGYENKP